MRCCDSESLRSSQCRGSGGCVEGDGKALCNLGERRAGEACLAAEEGGYLCSTSSADAALKCQGGTLRTEACKACAVQGGQVVCQQGGPPRNLLE